MIEALLGAAGAFAVIAAAFFTYLGVRGSNRVRAHADERTATQAAFSANIELNKYIDGRIEAAVAPLRGEIEGLRKREQSTKNIVRRFFQRLVFWDQNGRQGAMPMPSTEDMTALDLSDLELADT